MKRELTAALVACLIAATCQADGADAGSTGQRSKPARAGSTGRAKGRVPAPPAKPTVKAPGKPAPDICRLSGGHRYSRSCCIPGASLRAYSYPLRPVAASPAPPLAPNLSLVRRGSNFMRGIALGMYFKDPGYDYDRYLRDIRATGATHVTLVVSWFQQKVGTNRIFRHKRRTASDRRLKRTILQARRRGLRVMLLPIVRLVDRGPNDWRGVIKPGSWDLWWRSYGAYILHYARLASAAGVEVYSVGSELVSTENKRNRWLELIRGVRKLFKGRLLYSANWDHYEPVTFWDALDYIGVSSYFELSRETTPRMATLLAKWREVRSRMMKWRRKNHPGKPLVFTEAGYYSQNGTARYPWDYTRADKLNLRAQLHCYRAFVETWRRVPSLGGIFFWNWFGKGGMKDRGYTPRGKPAECVIRSWYGAPGVEWVKTDLPGALRLARQTKKTVLVDLYGPWCTPCKRMEREVFARPEVADLLRRHFIPIKVDGETAAGGLLKRKYNVVGYPTILLLGADGRERERVFGYKKAGAFLLALRNWLRRVQTIRHMERMVAKRPSDLKLRYDLGLKHALRGNVEQAIRHLALVSWTDHANRSGLASRALYVLGKYLFLRGRREYARALGLFETLRRVHPKSREAKYLRYPVARALLGMGRWPRARSELDAMVAENPGRSWPYESYAFFCARFGSRLPQVLSRGLSVAGQGLERHPRKAGLWWARSRVLAALGRWSQAARDLERAIRLKPGSRYYGRLLREARARAGRKRAAAKPRKSIVRAGSPGSRVPVKGGGPAGARGATRFGTRKPRSETLGIPRRVKP